MHFLSGGMKNNRRIYCFIIKFYDRINLDEVQGRAVLGYLRIEELGRRREGLKIANF